MSRRGYSICSGLLLLFGIWFFCGSTARAQAVDHNAAVAAYGTGNAMFDGCRFAEAAAAYGTLSSSIRNLRRPITTSPSPMRWWTGKKL